MTHEFQLLAQATIMAVVALGAWTAMGEGMALSGVARIASKLPPWLAMPLATCPRCMCSIWGITALLVFGLGVGVSWNFDMHAVIINWQRVGEIPVLIIAAVGIQEILHRP